MALAAAPAPTMEPGAMLVVRVFGGNLIRRPDLRRSADKCGRVSFALGLSLMLISSRATDSVQHELAK